MEMLGAFLSSVCRSDLASGPASLPVQRYREGQAKTVVSREMPIRLEMDYVP